MQPVCTISLRTLMPLLLAAAIQPAYASCGASFCSINTNWNMQGAAVEPGWRFDLRTEYIDQDQPRSGSGDVEFGQIRRHHDEVETRNRNVLAALDYAVNDRLGFSVTVPVIDRDHEHIHNHRGAKIPESWDFTRLGDIRLQSRVQWDTGDQSQPGQGHYGITLGVKLPTGQIHVENSRNQLAERSLQPGTGTADMLLGAYYNRLLANASSSWFVQGLWQQPLDSRENYEPGHRISADLGYRYELNPKIGLMAQLNTLFIERDHGAEAEPRDTGGKFVHLSPGASFAVTPNAQLYGFVQLPVYQYVNGVQLTADWSLAAGVSVRF